MSEKTPSAPCAAAWRWLRTFSRSLIEKSLQKPIEFLTLVVGTLSVALLIWQLWALNDTLDSQAYNAITVGLSEIDKLSVENSELRPYFTKNIPFPDDKVQRLKVRTLVDAKLDFIDSFYAQFNHINWRHYTRAGWDSYFEQSFKCSAVLRETYCRDVDQYGEGLQDFLGQIFPSGMCNNKQANAFSPPDNYCGE
jgi:hypothetical protein